MVVASFCKARSKEATQRDQHYQLALINKSTCFYTRLHIKFKFCRLDSSCDSDTEKLSKLSKFYHEDFSLVESISLN